jgi:microcompartment protein CcmK/EutM
MRAPRWSACFSVLAFAGCTTAQLSENASSGSWQFTSDLETTSQCLVRSLNAEWQPKNSVDQFLGRSILHSIVNVEPGRTNHVVHENIGAGGNGWMFVVSAAARGTAAEAHVLTDAHVLNISNALDRMEHAAGSCGGIRRV